jgi:hypothetical protein
LCLSLTLPGFFSGSEGFAGETEANLIFLSLLAISFGLSVYAIVFALNHYEKLAVSQRVFAVLPSILMSLTGFTIYLSL